MLCLATLAAGRIRVFIRTQQDDALHPLPGTKTENLGRLCILVRCIVAAHRVLTHAALQKHALHELDRDAQFARLGGLERLGFYIKDVIHRLRIERQEFSLHIRHLGVNRAGVIIQRSESFGEPWAVLGQPVLSVGER